MPTLSPTQLLELHDKLRIGARRLYEDGLNPVDQSADWRQALTEARMMISEALRASDFLFDVSGALQQSGRHMLVFRHLMAPPVSQDQFKLICSDWPKSTEKTGAAVKAEKADIVNSTFQSWLALRLAPWLRTKRRPAMREINSLLMAVAPLIASQRVATARRNRLAHIQEVSLIEKLESNGWQLLPTRTIDQQGALLPHQFMHKARFASGLTGRISTGFCFSFGVSAFFLGVVHG